MNKEDDQTVSQSYMNGYNDFISFGFDCPCPYELESKEASYWTMGFNDSIQDGVVEWEK